MLENTVKALYDILDNAIQHLIDQGYSQREIKDILHITSDETFNAIITHDMTVEYVQTIDVKEDNYLKF